MPPKAVVATPAKPAELEKKMPGPNEHKMADLIEMYSVLEGLMNIDVPIRVGNRWGYNRSLIKPIVENYDEQLKALREKLGEKYPQGHKQAGQFVTVPNHQLDVNKNPVKGPDGEKLPPQGEKIKMDDDAWEAGVKMLQDELYKLEFKKVKFSEEPKDFKLAYKFTAILQPMIEDED
jgi:hypothetical protein